MSTDKITPQQLLSQGFTIAELPDNLGMSLYGRENIEYLIGFDPCARNNQNENAIISIKDKVVTYNYRPYDGKNFEDEVQKAAQYFKIDPKHILKEQYMEESLRKFILELNCKIVNPIKKSLNNSEVVGWYCKTPSILRKDTDYQLIQKFIKDNSLDYYLTGESENNAEFFIYIHTRESKLIEGVV